MKELGIDIETYSSHDLTKCGVYKYVEAPDFEILLFAYSVDGGVVRCVDLASGEQLPKDIKDALTDPTVIKTAYNAAFERICISRYLGRKTPLDPRQWRCTMIRAARMGLPLSLAQCGEALRLEDRKMSEGRALIRFFSLPVRKTKNGITKMVRHRPEDDPEKWKLFKRYNIRDVEVEQAILKKVRRMEAPEFEDDLYVADQHINDRGVMVDRVLVDNAARFDDTYKEELLAKAREITGMDNPNSPAQIKAYVHQATGFTIDSLNKKKLDDYETQFKYWPKVQELLAIRRELGKTSNKKYKAIQECICDGGRVHGLLQFYGAVRSGRWAGRLVQLQNLPQNHLSDLDYARYLVKRGDLEEFEMNYDNVTQVLSELIRTAFIAKPGCTFHVCDFSAIEARVIAWIAGEEWVLDAFRQGHDIYCETASRMFGVPVEKHGVNGHLRQRGKVAVLGLGYGGGVNALDAMGGSRMGLTETEMKSIVDKWRESNPNIVKLWRIVEKAVIAAVKTGRSITIHRGIVVSFRWGVLLITLPSGRTLCYPRAKIITETNRWGNEQQVITYEGTNQTSRKWETQTTYGGKLTENIVQATARDILGMVILRAERQRLNVVFHVHDEIVVETTPDRTLHEVEALFSEPIPWCRDLPLKGAGYTTPYYLKD
ncbi:MAG: DNA polymerase [Prevotella sp.]|jgi:DNA polymerase